MIATQIRVDLSFKQQMTKERISKTRFMREISNNSNQEIMQETTNSFKITLITEVLMIKWWMTRITKRALSHASAPHRRIVTIWRNMSPRPKSRKTRIKLGMATIKMHLIQHYTNLISRPIKVRLKLVKKTIKWWREAVKIWTQITKPKFLEM